MPLLPPSFRALLGGQGQLIDQAILFDAGTAAFRAVIVLQERACLTDRQSLVDFGLGPARHSGEGPPGHRGGEVPTADEQRWSYCCLLRWMVV